MKLMEFVYTDEVGDLPFSTAIELLVVAEQFLLDRLKRVCEDKIRRGIALDNAVNICITAHQFQATSLKVLGVCADQALCSWSGGLILVIL